ncbi:MAG: hypothetical protein GY701_19620 [Sulfitobacter sp.]|nr:hypothetical protein [Sulfitobacter sp.]
MGEPKTDIELRFKALEIATALEVAAEVSAYAAPGDVRDSAEMLYQWLSDGSAPRRLEVPAGVVEAALRVQYNSDTADPPVRVLAEYVLSQIGQPDE